MKSVFVASVCMFNIVAYAQWPSLNGWNHVNTLAHALTQHADSAGGGNWQLTALTEAIGRDSTYLFRDSILAPGQAGQPVKLDACMLFDDAHPSGGRGGVWLEVRCADPAHNLLVVNDEVNRKFRYCMGPYVLYTAELTLPLDAQSIRYGFGLKGPGWLKVRRLNMQIGAETTGTGYTFEALPLAHMEAPSCKRQKSGKCEGRKHCRQRCGKKKQK